MPYKGREPYDAATVFVYRNLHRSMWSVLAMDGKHAGLVVAHAHHVVLDHARWRVNEAGRLRVVATGHKNVHAGVLGMLADVERQTDWRRVTYNPYTTAHFVDVDSRARVDASRFSMFATKGKAYAA
jgi:hypothetical protein